MSEKVIRAPRSDTGIGRKTCPVGVERILSYFGDLKLEICLPGKLALSCPLPIRHSLFGRRGPRPTLALLIEELAGPAKLVEIVSIGWPVVANAGPVELTRDGAAPAIVIVVGELPIKERFVDAIDRHRVKELQPFGVDPAHLPIKAGHLGRDITLDKKSGYPNVFKVVFNPLNLATRWEPERAFASSKIEITSPPLLSVRIPISGRFQVLAPYDAEPGFAIDLFAHDPIQLTLEPLSV